MNQALLQADIANVMPSYIATGLAKSVCTIQSPSQAADAVGQPDLATWTDVPGMVGIACQIEPLVELRPQDTDEANLPGFTEEFTEAHVLLTGYYPLIEQRYRAVIDGVPWDIRGVESDSQMIMTRMAVRQCSI